jgi:hypothetical protein
VDANNATHTLGEYKDIGWSWGAVIQFELEKDRLAAYSRYRFVFLAVNGRSYGAKYVVVRAIQLFSTLTTPTTKKVSLAEKGFKVGRVDRLFPSRAIASLTHETPLHSFLHTTKSVLVFSFLLITPNLGLRFESA